ncbi:MAG: hypothetical protein ACYDBJ_12975 [Aggregatilineales bacterium]
MNADHTNKAEQERANRLAEALDRLMQGEPTYGADPLLAVAQDLLAAPIQPSPAAVARFNQQVNRWFSPAAPRPQLRFVPRIPWIAAGFVLAITLVAAGIALRQTVFAPPTPTVVATPTPTPTALPSLTSTFTPTETPTVTPTSTFSETNTTVPTATNTAPLTATLTISATETAADTITSTPADLPVFAQVIISGTIDGIQGAIITIFGQAIHIQGGVAGLCVGDWVSLKANLLPSELLQVDRSAITVVTSACVATRVPPLPPTSSNPGNGGGDNHHHGHGDD